jgi:hypothetical protein
MDETNAVVRGENARRKYNVMIKWCTASAPETLDELQAAVHLQSGKSYFVHFFCGSSLAYSFLIVHFLQS